MSTSKRQQSSLTRRKTTAGQVEGKDKERHSVIVSARPSTAFVDENIETEEDNSGGEGETLTTSSPNNQERPPLNNSESLDADGVVNKKAQFRKYLVKSGFKYAVIRAIVALYEDDEKPDDPLSWVLGFIGLGIPKVKDIEKVREQANEIMEKIRKLQDENSELKAKITEREEALKPDPVALFKAEWQKVLDEIQIGETS